ncbi:MAG TPA: enolase C-terminal domain-like protein [Rhizomicrobium sp.]|nr:enolase C-terminal domain-like protein [Rhizomicrobium sp.]
MNRRNFLTSAAGVAGAGSLAGLGSLAFAYGAHAAGLPSSKITRIRYYRTPTDAAGRPNVRQPLFNQSTYVVLVETDSGLVGVGEGGAQNVMEQLAGQLIGEDPFRTERLWQNMHRAYFYPAGREKTHAIGALDCALWDLKAKALGVPLYQLLGGKARNHVECYATGYSIPGQPKASHRELARACIEAGFHTYRIHDPGPGPVFNRFDQLNRIFDICKEAREGCGRDGGWAIDFHGALDQNDGIELATRIEPLRPYFAEDIVRSDNLATYRLVRSKTKVPIAVGEVLGNKWDWQMLIEEDLMDYARVTIPNVGGVSEFMKIAAMCETHTIGLIPHFTGPIATATLVHCVAATSVPALMEMNGSGRRVWPYLKQGYDFKDGKLLINDRPGNGCEVDTTQLHMMAEYTERHGPTSLRERTDGSYTNW